MIKSTNLFFLDENQSELAKVEIDSYHSEDVKMLASHLYSERNIDGSWINSYDLESIIQRYEELLPVFENDVSDEEMKSLFGEDWKQINV